MSMKLSKTCWKENKKKNRERNILKVLNFLEDIRKNNSAPLTYLTNGIHYHTIEASDPEAIQEALKNLDKLGFLC